MNNRKNVLIIIDSLVGGGAERVILTLAAAMQEAGHNAIILNLKGHCEHAVPDGVKIVDANLNVSSRSARKHKHRFEKIISDLEHLEGAFDLVLANLSLSYSFCSLSIPEAYLVIHNTVSKEIESLGGVLKKMRRKRRMKKQFKKMRLVCVSKGVREDIIRFLRIPQENCQVIYNPFNVGEIQRLAELNPETPFAERDYIICTGRLTDQKRQDVLIKVFSGSEITGDLVLLGQGPKEEELRALVRSLGLESRVHFAGFKKNPYPYIKNAKLMVLSSDYEGLPTVIIESLICGTPVVSTDCPSGPREILEECCPEMLCPVGDVDALAGRIQACWNRPSNINYKEAVKKYEMARVAKQYLSLIEDQ